MRIVMYPSKDWSFSQILVNLFHIFEVFFIITIIFCNFAVKQQ